MTFSPSLLTYVTDKYKSSRDKNNKNEKKMFWEKMQFTVFLSFWVCFDFLTWDVKRAKTRTFAFQGLKKKKQWKNNLLTTTILCCLSLKECILNLMFIVFILITVFFFHNMSVSFLNACVLLWFLDARHFYRLDSKHVFQYFLFIENSFICWYRRRHLMGSLWARSYLIALIEWFHNQLFLFIR